MQMRFEPVSWAANSGIYEVNLRQYTPEGSFNAFAASLPRLADMGVDILWFMPVTPISQVKRLGTLGSYYACSTYTNTNPEFGSVADFAAVVQSAHALGMKVIIDWVANHTGWDHEWTVSHPGFYKKNAEGQFYDSNGWQDVIDLNYYDQQMRAEMIRCMKFWIDQCDIDGFRCDMAHLVPLDFWRDARRELSAIKPLFWLAETEDNNYQYAFDCSYAWNFMHVSENVAKGSAGTEELRQLLVEYQRKRLPYTQHLFFTSNHDENSWNGTEYEKYGAAALCFAVLASLWEGLCLVYSGQELPNRKRLSFFDKDPIDWSGDPQLHSFYRTLLTLRRSFGQHAAAVDLLSYAGDRNVVAFIRRSQAKEVLVLLNCSPVMQTASLPAMQAESDYFNVFDADRKKAPPVDNLPMEPWSYFVFEKR